MDKILHRLSVLAIILALASSSVGLFYRTGEAPRAFVNQYGDPVTIYGDGLYRNDSAFSAPIFRGTDAVILFLVVPLSALALWKDIRKTRRSDRFFLASMMSVILYYSASVVFGVAYNFLQLVYIALFSTGLSALVIAWISIHSRYGAQSAAEFGIKYKAVYVFLVLTGVALSIAWMPDIVSSIINRRPPMIIEVYTTVVTYALDIGLITPFAFITLHLLKKRNIMGYAFLASLLSLCVVVGIMMPVQTLFQAKDGIALPIGQMATKSGTFIVLAMIGAWLERDLFMAIKE